MLPPAGPNGLASGGEAWSALVVDAIGDRDAGPGGRLILGRVSGSAERSHSRHKAVGHPCGFGEAGHVVAREFEEVGAGLVGQPRLRLVQQ